MIGKNKSKGQCLEGEHKTKLPRSKITYYHGEKLVV